MFDTDEDHIDPRLREQIQAALENAISDLDLVRQQPLTRTLMSRYMRALSRDGVDPLARLLGRLQKSRLSLVYDGLEHMEAIRLVSRLQEEVAAFRGHRFYRYLALLSNWQGIAPANLNASLGALVALEIPRAGSPTRTANGLAHPGLLDVAGSAWNFVPSLKGTGPDAPTIVIPVYSGREDTLACLHSVLTAHNETSANVLVIDDRSPDQQLTEDLTHLAKVLRFNLFYHRENRGFVSSVNEGILATAGDVILLNSDTVVCDRWLDHLYTTAQSRADLASVSPLSNNATILSYPHSNSANPLPRDCSLSQLCAFLEAGIEADTLIEIPTSVGFCMYMRRPAIEDVGIFDEAAFGLGYGEESDWAMRARNKGYRHYAATRSFVYHIGTVSFAARAVQRQLDAAEILRGRHPNYWPLVADHVAADPLSKLRRELDARRLVAAAGQAPIVLHVLHALGGGTEAYVRHVSKLLKERGVMSLFAQPDDVGRIQLFTNVLSATPNLVFAGMWDDNAVAMLIRQLNVKCLHLHHVLGFASEILNLLETLDIPMVVTLHDYTYICPQVVLLNHRDFFCGVPSAVICHQCIAAKRPILDVANVAEWRHRMHRLVSRAQRISAPSKSAVELFNRVWPDAPIQVLPHPEPPIGRLPIAHVPDAMRVVAIVGAILSHKGAAIVQACARDAAARELPLKFLVAGDFESTVPDSHLAVTGRFSPPQLPEILREAGASIGFLPSVWPETYSYVLSEYYRFGLHPVVFNIGAQSERVRAAQYGTILPLNTGASAINDALLAIELDLAPRQPPTGLPEKTYLKACYGNILPLNKSTSPATS
jgi:GT2 family glycosyltransferase